MAVLVLVVLVVMVVLAVVVVLVLLLLRQSGFVGERKLLRPQLREFVPGLLTPVVGSFSDLEAGPSRKYRRLRRAFSRRVWCLERGLRKERSKLG